MRSFPSRDCAPSHRVAATQIARAVGSKASDSPMVLATGGSAGRIVPTTCTISKRTHLRRRRRAGGGQADRQAGRQAGGRAGKPAGRRAGRQAGKQASRQAGELFWESANPGCIQVELIRGRAHVTNTQPAAENEECPDGNERRGSSADIVDPRAFSDHLQSHRPVTTLVMLTAGRGRGGRRRGGGQSCN